MKITIDNREYELKYSFRTLMVYENITNKSFEPKSLTVNANTGENASCSATFTGTGPLTKVTASDNQ